jgi:hypothetical protein
MKSETELLPCHCGGKVRMIETPPTPGKTSEKSIFCDGCSAMWHKAVRCSAEELVQAWNTRPTLGGWQPMETAPKGGGAERVDDPKWVEPPKILLLFDEGEISVGYWDWYYAEDGHGYDGGLAWIEPCSGEKLDHIYGLPIKWQPLPLEPGQEKAG